MRLNWTPPHSKHGEGIPNQGGGGDAPSGGRWRVNVSLSEGVYRALRAVAEMTGKDLSTVAAAAIDDGIISQSNKASAVASLGNVLAKLESSRAS